MRACTLQRCDGISQSVLQDWMCVLKLGFFVVKQHISARFFWEEFYDL